MKKTFIHISLIVFMVYTSSIYAMEEQKKSTHESLIISPSNRTVEAEISAGERLRIFGNTREQTYNASFDAEDSDEQEVKLPVGSSVNLGPCVDITDSLANLTVTHDETIWNMGPPVKERNDYGVGRDKQEILFNKAEEEEEIQFFGNFLKSHEEGRGKLLSELSIIGHVRFLINLHEREFIKEFDSSIKSLKDRIDSSLKKQANKDVLCWQNEMDWFEEISEISTYSRTTGKIIENVLRKIFIPVPKVVFEWGSTENVEEVNLNLAGTKVIVYYKDGKKILGDLKNKIVLVEDYNIEKMIFNSTGTKAIVYYKNGEGRIINLENEKALRLGYDVREICLNPAGTRAIVYHNDGKGKIINLENREILFEDHDVKKMRLNSSDIVATIKGPGIASRRKIRGLESRRVVRQPDVGSREKTRSLESRRVVRQPDVGSRGEIINLENEKTIFEGDNVREICLNLAGTKATVWYEDGREKIINLENGKILFIGNNVKEMTFNSAGTRAIVQYKNCIAKIRDLEDGRELFAFHKFRELFLHSTAMKAIATYENGKEEIINLENEKVLFEGHNVAGIVLSPTGMKAIVRYQDNRGEIIDLENGKILFEGNNIRQIYVNSADTRAVVEYRDGKGEIRNLKNRRILFEGHGIKKIRLNSVGMKAKIHYKDSRGEIRDLKNGGLLFEGNDIKIAYNDGIQFNSTGTRAKITYNDRIEIIDLEDYDRDIVFKELEQKQLLFIFFLKNLNSSLDIATGLISHHSLWKSFNSDLQQKLLKSYFPEQVRHILYKKLESYFPEQDIFYTQKLAKLIAMENLNYDKSIGYC